MGVGPVSGILPSEDGPPTRPQWHRGGRARGSRRPWFPHAHRAPDQVVPGASASRRAEPVPVAVAVAVAERPPGSSRYSSGTWGQAAFPPSARAPAGAEPPVPAPGRAEGGVRWPYDRGADRRQEPGRFPRGRGVRPGADGGLRADRAAAVRPRPRGREHRRWRRHEPPRQGRPAAATKGPANLPVCARSSASAPTTPAERGDRGVNFPSSRATNRPTASGVISTAVCATAPFGPRARVQRVHHPAPSRPGPRCAAERRPSLSLLAGITTFRMGFNPVGGASWSARVHP